MLYLVEIRIFLTGGLCFSSQLDFIHCRSVNKFLLTLSIHSFLLLFKEIWKALLSQIHILVLE